MVVSICSVTSPPRLRGSMISRRVAAPLHSLMRGGSAIWMANRKVSHSLAKLPATAELIETNGPARSTPVTLDDLQQVREHIARLKARGARESAHQQDTVERARGWVVAHATAPSSGSTRASRAEI